MSGHSASHHSLDVPDSRPIRCENPSGRSEIHQLLIAVAGGEEGAVIDDEQRVRPDSELHLDHR